MENQSVLLFRQKNRWGLTVLSILLSLLLAPFAGLAAMMPMVLAAVPVLTQMLLGYVGPVSAVVCTIICIGVGGMLYGTMGLLAAAVLFVPALLTAAWLVQRQEPFWQSAGICAITMFISMGAVVGALTLTMGSDVVTQYAGIVRDMFEGLGNMVDPLLVLFMQMGMLPVPQGLDLSSTTMAVLLTPDMRRELIEMVVLMLDSGLRMMLPADMVTGSAMVGVLGHALLRKGLLTRGVAVPYPRLRTWRLPKGWGRVLGVTLIAFYLLAELLPERMNSTFYVFTQVFDTLFVVQGIAAMCYLLHKSGKGKLVRTLVVFAGFVLVRPLALGIGIADQGIDFTHRRAELDQQDNPYDPFGGKMEL